MYKLGRNVVVSTRKKSNALPDDKTEMVASIVANIMQSQSNTVTQMAEVAVRTVIDKTEDKIADEVEERIRGKRKKLWPMIKKAWPLKKNPKNGVDEDDEELEREAERSRIARLEKLKASKEMVLLESEKEFRKYLNEFRLRPSKVSAEFFYNSKTSASFKMVEKTLYVWLDIFSEFDALPDTNFTELYNLAKSLKIDDENTADTLRVFYLLRTHGRSLIAGKNEVLEILAVNLSVKSLVCQMFIALMEDNVINIYKLITLSLYEEVKMLRSVLSSLDKTHLMHLRNRLRHGHARADYTCPCHLGKVALHLKCISHASERGRQCEVLLFLDEVNTLVKIMESSQRFTRAHQYHLIAGRHEFARHYHMKNKKHILKELEGEGGEEESTINT